MFQLLHSLTSDCNVSLYCISFLPIILVLTSKDELLKPHLRTHVFQVPQLIKHWKDPLSLDCRRIFSRTQVRSTNLDIQNPHLALCDSGLVGCLSQPSF